MNNIFRQTKSQLLLLFFLLSFNSYMPFIGIFLTSSKNISLSQLPLVLAIYSVSVALLELPTGIIADKIGEKKSIRYGILAKIIGISLLLSMNIWLIFVGQFFIAAGDSFISGADSSFIFKIINNNKEVNSNYDQISASISSMNWISIAVAGIAGTAVFAWNSSFCFILTILSLGLSLIVLANISNPINQTTKEIKLRNINIFKNALLDLKENTELRSHFIQFVCFLSSTITGFLLLQPLLGNKNIAGQMNGFLYAGITICAALGSILRAKYPNTLGTKKMLFMIFSLITVLLVLQYSASLFHFFILAAILRLLWGYSGPLFSSSLQKSIKKDSSRSTIGSLTSLAINLMVSILLFASSIISPERQLLLPVLTLIILVGLVTISLRKTLNIQSIKG